MNEKKVFLSTRRSFKPDLFVYLHAASYITPLWEWQDDCVLFYLNNMYKKTYKERGREKERINFKTAANKNEVNI